MPVLGAIEISPDCDGRMPGELIEQAYRLSRSGRVLLVLNGMTAQDVNRILDPVVATMPLSIPGVLYISISDGKKLLEAIEVAPAICAASHLFRHFVASHGYRWKLRDSGSFLAFGSIEAGDIYREPERLDVHCATLLDKAAGSLPHHTRRSIKPSLTVSGRG